MKNKDIKELGYYYSKSLKTVLIGYTIDHKHQNREQLSGMVIGHTIPSPPWGHTFHIGYKYKQWNEDFVYVGRLTTFTTLKGYLDFLQPASTKQIEAYFAIKKVVLERHCSHIINHSNGFRYRITFKEDTLKQLGII